MEKKKVMPCGRPYGSKEDECFHDYAHRHAVQNGQAVIEIYLSDEDLAKGIQDCGCLGSDRLLFEDEARSAAAMRKRLEALIEQAKHPTSFKVILAPHVLDELKEIVKL